MKLSLVVQTPEVEPIIPVALLSGSFEDKLAKASRLGVDGLELMTTEPTRLDAEEIKKQFIQYGLSIPAIASGAIARYQGLTLINKDPSKSTLALKRLRELIDLAALVGAPLVTIGSFRGWSASIAEDGRSRLIQALREAGDQAKGRDIRLVVEPLNRYEADLIQCADEGLAFLDELGHSSVGLLLDTYHVNIEESSWTKPFEKVMRKDKLWHVHIGDNNRLPPGQGLIDFSAIIATLKRVGYQGYLSAELLALPDPDTAARQTAEAIQPLLKSETLD